MLQSDITFFDVDIFTLCHIHVAIYLIFPQPLDFIFPTYTTKKITFVLIYVKTEPQIVNTLLLI